MAKKIKFKKLMIGPPFFETKGFSLVEKSNKKLSAIFANLAWGGPVPPSPKWFNYESHSQVDMESRSKYWEADNKNLYDHSRRPSER